MTKLKNTKNSLISGNALLYLISLGISVAVSIIIMVVFALLMTTIDVTKIGVDAFGVISLSFGALIGSIFLGFKIKKGGLLLGAINGTIILLLVFVLGSIVNGLTFNLLYLVKIISVVFSSLGGGIYAVNKVAKRRV